MSAGSGSCSFISTRSARPSRVSFCGAAVSTRFSRSGKNVTFAGAACPSGGVIRTTSVLPLTADSNVHPGGLAGSFERASAIRAPASAGNVRSSSPFSGMHTSLHTSHSALALIVALRAVASGGGVSSASSTTSSSYPMFISGPTGSGFGYGHWISPAFHPSGSTHWMRVGKPESPGFFQYVCHSGAMRRCSPTVTGLPGCAELPSEMSRASTCSVFTTGAAPASAAPRASRAAALR
jgi:hypothetical protein